MKLWYQSKTVWFNLITLILAIFALPQFISVIPASWLPYIALINGIGNLILRLWFTSVPVVSASEFENNNFIEKPVPDLEPTPEITPEPSPEPTPEPQPEPQLELAVDPEPEVASHEPPKPRLIGGICEHCGTGADCPHYPEKA